MVNLAVKHPQAVRNTKLKTRLLHLVRCRDPPNPEQVAFGSTAEATTKKPKTTGRFSHIWRDRQFLLPPRPATPYPRPDNPEPTTPIATPSIVAPTPVRSYSTLALLETPAWQEYRLSGVSVEDEQILYEVGQTLGVPAPSDIDSGNPESTHTAQSHDSIARLTHSRTQAPVDAVDLLRVVATNLETLQGHRETRGTLNTRRLQSVRARLQKIIEALEEVPALQEEQPATERNFATFIRGLIQSTKARLIDPRNWADANLPLDVARLDSLRHAERLYHQFQDSRR